MDVLDLLIDNNDLPNETERIKIIASKKINPKVIGYIKSKFDNLKIEICGDFEGTIIELMESGKLEGWCWQTSETAALFLEDNDYITRGNLKLYKNGDDYHHAWICFKYKNKEYVFDPCLNLICKKRVYNRIFQVKIMGKVKSKTVRELLVEKLLTPKEEKETSIVYAFFNQFEELKEALKKQQEFTLIKSDENINAPFYRNNSGYKAEIENGKIKSLVAHYYMNA